MTRKELILLFENIEKKGTVYRWTYGDVCIWPIVKKDISFLIFNQNQTQKAPAEIRSKKSAISRLLGSLVSWGRLIVTKAYSPDTVYSGAASHRVLYKGSFVNRYFFPSLKLKKEKTLTFEYGAKVHDKTYSPEEDIVFIASLYPLAKVLRIFKTRPEMKLEGWSDFCKLVESQSGLSLTSYKRSLPKVLESVMTYVNIYDYLFTKYLPRRVLSLCYYKNEMFALHYVANNHRILNYDVQHGGQGSLHPMYTFSNIPFPGLNTLPQVFWCWDEVSAQHIQKWVCPTSQSVEIKGNPWVDYLSSVTPLESSLPKLIVTYTLQSSVIEQYVLDAIKLTGTQFKWFLRLHPRMDDSKEGIHKQLKDNDLMRYVEIDKASELPLPYLLKNSLVHISGFSGSIIEAVQVGTPNIIIEEMGAEMYKEYIQNGNAIAILSKNGMELYSQIISILQRSNN